VVDVSSRTVLHIEYYVESSVTVFVVVQPETIYDYRDESMP